MIDDVKLQDISKVSIVVPTYRRDNSLKNALESINDQTYPEIEIIVVDDNADENWNSKVLNIINKLNLQFPIKYIKNDNNKGSAETRNIGIRSATGKFISFLDDDDIYLPNKIKNQVIFMINQQSDFNITDLEFFNEMDILIEKRDRQYLKNYNQKDLFRYHLLYHMTGTDTMMFKKDYLVKIDGFPPIDVGDEYYLMQKAIEAGGRFSYLPVCDVKAYVHTKTEGLSSGDSKINGENNLYQHKKKYFSVLNKSDVRYIKMRHYAVLAYAKYRSGDILEFLKYALYSFLSNPYQCLKLILKRSKK